MTLIRILFAALIYVSGISLAQAQATFTTVATGDWDDGATYGNTSPGVQGTDWPAITDNVVIAAGYTVTMTSAETINDFTINFGGEFDFDGFQLTIGGTVLPFVSKQTGEYSASGTWLNGTVPTETGDVVISKGTRVTLTANTIMGNLSINPRAVLDDGSVAITVIQGNLLLNGTLYGRKDTNMKGGVGITIDGTGVYSQGKFKINGDVTILSTADLSFIKEIEIQNDIRLTNNGTISTANVISGLNAGSAWINATGSFLSAGDKVLDPIGVLDASASGNTIEYNGKDIQNITDPVGSVYHHLIISGLLEKTILANTTINGDLSIEGGTLDTDVTNNYDLTLAGDFTNSSAFKGNLSTVIFNGTGSQTITNTSGETFYDFTLNKASGILTLKGDVIVSNTLTLTLGDIDAGTNTLTLGTGTGNPGTYSYTSGRIDGQFERWIANTSSGTDIDFGIGTTNNSRVATINFSGIATGGTVLFSFVESDPGNSGLSLDDVSATVYNTFVDGYWDMSIANGFDLGANTFDLDFNGTGFIGYGIDAATRVVTRATDVSTWTVEGTHSNGSDPLAFRTGLSTMPAQYAFGDDLNCSGPTTSAITGSTEVCTDDSSIAYSVTDNSNTYTWIITGGVQVSGGSTASITVDWGPTGQVGNVRVVETNGCTSGAVVNLAVNVNTIAPSSITGSTYVPELEPDRAYSVTDLGYTYTWTITGGTLGTGQGTNSITVDWGSAGAGNVSVVAQKLGCAAAAAFDIDVKKYIIINSISDGEWADPTIWDSGTVPINTESARVMDGDSVWISADASIFNFILEAGGVIDAMTSNKKLKVNGEFTLNGTYYGDTSPLELRGINSTIDGIGTINFSNAEGVVDIRKGSKTIASTAVINITAGILNLMDAGVTVQNYGSISIAGDLTDNNDASCIWTNKSNSTLNVGGTVMANNGTFNASAIGNTVNYIGAAAQGVIVPSSSYYNLILDSLGTKTALGSLDINGDLTINGLVTLDVATNTADLTVAGDWVNNSIFTPEGQTVTLDGSSAQSISGTTITTFNNLTINNASGGVTLSSPAIIGSVGTLTLTSGLINTDAVNILTVNSGGAASGDNADSYVDGPLKKIGNTDFIFPSGDGSIWAPVGLTNVVGGSATTEFTGQYFHSPAPNQADLPASGLNHASTVEYWQVSNNTLDVISADLDFYWKDADVSGITDIVGGDLVVIHYNSGSSEWEVLATIVGAGSTIGAGGTGYITATFTSFSPVGFGFVSSNNPLPVELLSFNAGLTENGVKVDWSTASEYNNDYFTIEKSQDGVEFDIVMQVAGEGSSNDVLEYTELDEFPFTGISYYRLMQTDFDGTESYSSIVSVMNENSLGKVAFVVYPNPSKAGEDLDIIVRNLNTEEFVKINIVDLAGNTVYKQIAKANSAGGLRTKFSIGRYLANGIYIVNVITEKSKINKKLLIK